MPCLCSQKCTQQAKQIRYSSNLLYWGVLELRQKGLVQLCMRKPGKSFYVLQQPDLPDRGSATLEAGLHRGVWLARPELQFPEGLASPGGKRGRGRKAASERRRRPLPTPVAVWLAAVGAADRLGVAP